MLCWTWRDVMPAKRPVKTLQVAGCSEERLLRLAHAGQCVEIRCQPAIISGQEPGNKIGWRTRIGSHQIFPGGSGGRSARNKNSSGPNAKLAAVKIQLRSAQNQFFRPQRLPQELAR